MILLTNQYSNFKNGQKEPNKYGSKGDMVKLISDHGNILIVQLNGNKFPVKKEEVTE